MTDGLRIKDLSVTFQLRDRDVRAVDGVSVHFPAGQITGIIGESGCGKSVLGMAVLGLLPPYAKAAGSITLDGSPLLGTRRALGVKLGLIPQNPAESLNPARTVQAHLSEALRPLSLSRREAKAWSAQLLRDFGFPDPARVLKAYPHELSGGMQQRVLCAVGSACTPAWLLADEPTKGLDSALRDQVLDTLGSMRGRGVASMLVITHDLTLARSLCQSLAVMYAGQVLEMGQGVLEHPLHPYTAAFLNALPEHGFQPIQGIAPRAGQRLPGCPFAPRCPHCRERCTRERPGACQPESQHMVRCFLYE
ncbi:ABC transporter ATP-binding protein [uncultured Dysosmobacter sp.]|uniref:ABC transporter ATP-binding protein n=1 Tax=uncultured Dysosmobacter sp. TaxID=2591384 RepID=UPI002619ABA3|nr:ABC transporter ATP-binding protein [uncultured Dysosmobacter sp.]